MKFTIPSESATKQLKFKTTGGRRKIVVSSNWLPLFGFETGTSVREVSLGRGEGIVVERVNNQSEGGKRVYSRTYKQRRNNPIESLIETSSRQLLDRSFPLGCERVHVTFTWGKIYIRPIVDRLGLIVDNVQPENAYDVFGVCTSGVDLTHMEDEGFRVHSVIEWRPPEKRDKDRDLTETGALSVLRNLRHGVRHLFNEDVGCIDIQQIADAVQYNPATVLVASPVCDDYSNVKAKSLKDKHLDDMQSSVDMAYDMLRVIEAALPAVIQFEQVPGWYKSDAYALVKLRLRRWGYREHLLIGDARDYAGHTSRTRGYAVFTCLDSPFRFEPPLRTRQGIWPIVLRYLHECREVTSSKSIQDGARCGRLRTIRRDSTHSPTFLKSQSRMAKDSVVIDTGDGRYYWPSEGLMKALMGIPARYEVDAVSSDIGSEIIGQSVDGGLHATVVRSIKAHIDTFLIQQEVRCA